MKRLLYVLLLIPSIAFAKEDIECAKKHTDAQIHCNAHKKMTIVRIVENGGECADYTLYLVIPEGYHWMIPPKNSCHYISGLTLYTLDGKIYTFAPL